jgi:hypothetical protein
MNSNNLKQQPLAEPAYVDGTAVKKQIPSENFPSHNYDQTIRPDQPSVQPIPVGQAGGIPFDEHLHLNPTEHVILPPNAEHVHITAGPDDSGNVEHVIRIKPDGKVQVTAEKVGEHHTETLKQENYVQPLKQEHVLPKQEHHVQPLRREHEVTPIVGLEKEHTNIKKVSEKKKHVEKVKDVPTETTTVVKISEHEPGTAGYDREGKYGKHDDTHHHGKDHADTHHHGTDETKDTHHHGIFGKKDHADTHHHGTDETKVKVYKEHHGGKSGKKKHVKGGKHNIGTY